MCGPKLGGKKIAILGSTGSVGQNALQIVEANPEKFSVCALGAASSLAALAAQAIKHPNAFLWLPSQDKADTLKKMLPSQFAAKVFWGEAGLRQTLAVSQPAIALNAISGAAGLPFTVAVLNADIDLALANKESLVMAGPLVANLAKAKNLKILPVDSEHSALWQVWPENPGQIRQVWLTASGGPFLHFSLEQMRHITPAMALKHPRWRMGPKISVDSATLMNKGLEVLEAAFLFDFPLARIKAVVHPQSLVHGMLEMVDGSILAQMGPADMRLPIACALAYPERLPASWPLLNILELGRLEFSAPDDKRFPALNLALAAGRAGGSMPAILNAANEVAIEAFLNNNLPFLDIAVCVEETMSRLPVVPVACVEQVLEVDSNARRVANNWVSGRRNKC